MEIWGCRSWRTAVDHKRYGDTWLIRSLQTSGPFPLGKNRERPPATARPFLMHLYLIWKPVFCDSKAIYFRPESPSWNFGAAFTIIDIIKQVMSPLGTEVAGSSVLYRCEKKSRSVNKGFKKRRLLDFHFSDAVNSPRFVSTVWAPLGKLVQAAMLPHYAVSCSCCTDKPVARAKHLLITSTHGALLRNVQALIQALAFISTKGLIVALDLGACCTNKCFKCSFTETQRSTREKER